VLPSKGLSVVCTSSRTSFANGNHFRINGSKLAGSLNAAFQARDTRRQRITSRGSRLPNTIQKISRGRTDTPAVLVFMVDMMGMEEVSKGEKVRTPAEPYRGSYQRVFIYSPARGCPKVER